MRYILLYNGWGDTEEQLLVSISKSEAFHYSTTNIYIKKETLKCIQNTDDNQSHAEIY